MLSPKSLGNSRGRLFVSGVTVGKSVSSTDSVLVAVEACDIACPKPIIVVMSSSTPATPPAKRHKFQFACADKVRSSYYFSRLPRNFCLKARGADGRSSACCNSSIKLSNWFSLSFRDMRIYLSGCGLFLLQLGAEPGQGAVQAHVHIVGGTGQDVGDLFAGKLFQVA